MSAPLPCPSTSAGNHCHCLPLSMSSLPPPLPPQSLPPPPSRCRRRRRRQRHHRRHHQPPSPHDHRWLCPTATSDDDNSHLLPHCPSPHPPLDEDATRLFHCRRGCHWRRRLRCLRRRLRLRSQDDGAKKDGSGERRGFLHQGKNPVHRYLTIRTYHTYPKIKKVFLCHLLTTTTSED